MAALLFYCVSGGFAASGCASLLLCVCGLCSQRLQSPQTHNNPGEPRSGEASKKPAHRVSYQKNCRVPIMAELTWNGKHNPKEQQLVSSPAQFQTLESFPHCSSE